MDISTCFNYGMSLLTSSPEWQMTSQGHETHELIVIRRGKMHVTVGDQQYTARSGDVLWYPRGVAHTERCASPGGFESAFGMFIWPEVPAPPGNVLQHDKDGRIAVLTQWLLDERDLQHDPQDPLPVSLFRSIIAEFLRLCRREVDPLVDEIRAYMSRHLRDALTLDDLADAAHISKYHFVRRYKALTGHTPMEDLRLMRLQRARELILITNLPLREIAPRVGLGDEFHMSRLFRRYLGAPPGAFRA